MAFFKRVFSADFRRALAAEAAGEYGEAARAYALAGERAKVAEMHLLAAERAGTPEARLADLRSGLRWADADSDEDRAIRRRIARAMLMLVRGAGGESDPAPVALSDRDRATLREAATLFAGAGDHAGAGECQELAGDELQAAESYQRAGEVDRLEAVLARDEKRRRHDTRLREAFEEYSMFYAAGERDLALSVLRSSVAEGADTHGEHARLAGSIEERRIAGSRVGLRAGDDGTLKRLTCIGAFPLGLGRDVGCEVVLRDAGISRRHAEILEAGGRFRVRDCSSKNGTFLGGCAVDGELPLEREGELRIGESCAFQFRASAGALELTATRGLDRGLRVLASMAPIALVAGIELRFVGGLPFVAAAGAERALLLNGARTGKRVQLLRGDVIEVIAPGGGRGGDEAAPRLARIEVDAWPSGSG